MQFLFGVMEKVFRSFAGIKYSITTTSHAFKMFYLLVKYRSKCSLLKVSTIFFFFLNVMILGDDD